MAKSDSFFGQRTKSTKSLTFSTWRGIQITKDRVKNISNPQSAAQMQQRILMPLVGQARTQLKGLVNHSFQGVDYGYKSLYHFSSVNLKSGYLKVSQYVPSGSGLMGLANYTVSEGSMPTNKIGGCTSIPTEYKFNTDWKDYDPTNFCDAFYVPCFHTPGNTTAHEYTADFSGDTPTGLPSDEEIFEGIKAALLDDTDNDQISFLCLIGNSAFEWEAADGSNSWTQTIYRPYLYRIDKDTKLNDGTPNEISLKVNDGGNPTAAWNSQDTPYVVLKFGNDFCIGFELTIKAAEGTTVGSNGKYSWEVRTDLNLNHYDPTGATYEKPDDAVFYGLTPYTEADNCNALVYPCPMNSDGTQYPILGGFTVISSRKDNSTYRRSRQAIATVDGTIINADAVLDTYRKSSGASNKFLNSGNDSTSIPGNSGNE